MSVANVPASGRNGTTKGYTPMSIRLPQAATSSSGSSPRPTSTYVDTRQGPKTRTACAQASS